MNQQTCAELPVEVITRRIEDVPALPLVVSRLLEIVGRDNHSVTEVVRIVENDLALTARVLKIANSAAFSRGNHIPTLPRAILHLGEKMVVGIALGSCTAQIFKPPLEGYGSAAGELWEHSLRTAIATRELVRFALQPVSADLAFTAGLLHDVGKAIISEFLQGNAEEMARWCDTGKVADFLQAERDVVGTDHSQVGETMALRWKLPLPLTAVIRDHHRPAQSEIEHRGLVFAVHVGDLIAMMGGAGTGVDTLAYRMDPGCDQYLRLNCETMEKIFLAVQAEFASKKASIFEALEA